MSLLLDALKEAEKSRKGHRLEESKKDSIRPQQEDPEVLDLDLFEEEDGNSCPTATQPEAEPVSTELTSTEPSPAAPSQTESVPTKHPATAANIKETEDTRARTKKTDSAVVGSDHLTTTPISPIETHSAPKTAAAELNGNARVAAEVFQNRENKPSRPMSRLPLLLLLLVLVTIGLMALYFLLLPKDDSSFLPSHQTTMMEPNVSESDKLLESINTSIHIETIPTKTIPAETITDAKVTDSQAAPSVQADQTALNAFPKDKFIHDSTHQVSTSQASSSQSSAETTATALQQLTQQSSDYSAAKPQGTISSSQTARPVITKTAQSDRAQPQHSEIKISKRQLSPRTSQTLAEANQALEQGNLNAAELSYRQILKQSPGNLAATSALGHLLMQRGMTDEAERLYLQVLDQDPGNLEAKIALINISAADPTNLSAGSQLKQLLTKHPKQPYLHASLGNFYARRNDWSAAQPAYFEAFALENKNAEYAYNLAVSLDQLGKSDIAANYYEKALALHDNHPTQFNKSDVARRLKEIKGANQ